MYVTDLYAKFILINYTEFHISIIFIKPAYLLFAIFKSSIFLLNDLDKEHMMFNNNSLQIIFISLNSKV